MARKLSEAYSSPDATSINLAHLISRLESNLLSPSADLKPLRRSHYHRARVAANIEYGRTLLLQLERSLATTKTQPQKQTLQSDLLEKRQQLKSLRQRLDELGIEARAAAVVGSSSSPGSEADSFSSDDEEDILATPQNSTPDPTSRPSTGASIGANQNVITEDQSGRGGEGEGEGEGRTGEAPASETSLSSNSEALTPSSTGTEEISRTNTLRSRHTPSSLSTHSPHPTATTTATSTSASTSTPTSINKPSPPTLPTTTPTTSTSSSKPQTAEQSLTQDRSEQETLTESLLSLATQLKASSNNFHSSLEAEKSVLTRAVEGMDKSTTGLDAAGQRMGMLRRMSEGKGWWGRMMMYLWIFGLWIVALLIVYLGPKLRF